MNRTPATTRMESASLTGGRSRRPQRPRGRRPSARSVKPMDVAGDQEGAGSMLSRARVYAMPDTEPTTSRKKSARSIRIAPQPQSPMTVRISSLSKKDIPTLIQRYDTQLSFMETEVRLLSETLKANPSYNPGTVLNKKLDLNEAVLKELMTRDMVSNDPNIHAFLNLVYDRLLALEAAFNASGIVNKQLPIRILLNRHMVGLFLEKETAARGEQIGAGFGDFFRGMCRGNKCDVVEPIRAETFTNMQQPTAARTVRASSSRWAASVPLKESYTSLVLKGFEELSIMLQNNLIDEYTRALTQLHARLDEMKLKSVPIYVELFVSYLDRFVLKLNKQRNENAIISALTLTQQVKKSLTDLPQDHRLNQTEAIKHAFTAYTEAFKDKTSAQEKTIKATESLIDKAKEIQQLKRNDPRSKDYELQLGTASRRTERMQSAVHKATTELNAKITLADQARDAFIRELEKQEALQLKATATAARAISRSLTSAARTESAIKRSEAVLERAITAARASTSSRVAPLPATGGRKKKTKRI